MKPFNLEEALAGKKVVCRDPNITVLDIKYHDIKGLYDPVSVVFFDHKTVSQYMYRLKRDGRYSDTKDYDFDLFMAPETITIWYNIHLKKDGELLTRFFGSEYEAKEANKSLMDYDPTIKTYIKVAHKMEITQ